jgi:hypothetical protein
VIPVIEEERKRSCAGVSIRARRGEGCEQRSGGGVKPCAGRNSQSFLF